MVDRKKERGVPSGAELSRLEGIELTVSNSAGEGTGFFTPLGRIIEVNNALCRIMKKSPGAHFGKSIFGLISAEAKPGYKEGLTDLFTRALRRQEGVQSVLSPGPGPGFVDTFPRTGYLVCHEKHTQEF